MTNYPRDEFDRVPEFNTRVGSHHAHGWAQAASAKPVGAKLRWVVIVAVLVLAIGALSFFFGPGRADLAVSGGATTSPSAQVTQDESEQPGDDATDTVDPSEDTDATAEQSEEPTESPSASFDIDETQVLYGQRVGVYNGASIGGIAQTGKDALTAAGFTNVVADNWTRSAQTSTVYYMSDAYLPTAQKVAEALNISEVLQTTNIPNPVTAVLGADDPLGVR